MNLGLDRLGVFILGSFRRYPARSGPKAPALRASWCVGESTQTFELRCNGPSCVKIM